MRKNNIKIIDLHDEEIGYTNLNNANKLLKNNKGYFSDKETFYLKNIPKRKGKSFKEFLPKINIPKYTLSEELINAISHGIGVVFSIVLLVLCIIKSKDVYAIVSSCIYGTTSIILYLNSCLYHSLKVNKAKKVYRIIDHCSIYLLIAGTYTPYALVALRPFNPIMGWSLFIVIWLCAIIGLIITAIDMIKYKVLSMILYLVMGWMVIFNFKGVIQALNPMALKLMLAAGIIYTVGTIFYGFGKKVKYMHGIFHLFVLTASFLFFFSIYLYVL